MGTSTVGTYLKELAGVQKREKEGRQGGEGEGGLKFLGERDKGVGAVRERRREVRF